MVVIMFLFYISKSYANTVCINNDPNRCIKIKSATEAQSIPIQILPSVSPSPTPIMSPMEDE